MGGMSTKAELAEARRDIREFQAKLDSYLERLEKAEETIREGKAKLDWYLDRLEKAEQTIREGKIPSPAPPITSAPPITPGMYLPAFAYGAFV